MRTANQAKTDSKRPQFNLHRFVPRTALLDFVGKELDSKIVEKVGRRPERWYEELNIVCGIMTGETLGRIVGLFAPPIGDKDFKEIGKGIFIYNGGNRELRGLWTSRNATRHDFGTNTDVPYVEWTVWRLGDRADLAVNQSYPGINPADLLPDNFEPKSERISVKGGNGKRPILKFRVKDGEKQTTVFAKGSLRSLAFFCRDSRPRHRLTSLAGCSKVTSEREMNVALDLAGMGVLVPSVIGYYKAPFEEFLFLEEVEGKDPSHWLGTQRNSIIVQDARMLAALCRLGYHKQRFADFDDKIFNGRDLYLIDTEEVVDLYDHVFSSFREVLLDPADAQGMNEFRRFQMKMFMTELTDAIHDYRDSLLKSVDSRILYAKEFCNAIGMKTPYGAVMKALVTVNERHSTRDDNFAAMSDTD
jgi:hypothetical protein